MKINLTIEINDEDLKKLLVGTRDEHQTYVSDYARFFNDSCPGWSNDPECNLLYLKQQERWCNDMLQKKGYVFLNDVYDILGFPRTKIGQVVGWIYDEKHRSGDNYVSFNIYNIPSNKDFINGYEKTCLLDFNVDGEILSKI